MRRPKYHRGSVYCIAWSPDARLIATGSNDMSVRLLNMDPECGLPLAARGDPGLANTAGDPLDMRHHDGTVRDLTFLVSMTMLSSDLTPHHRCLDFQPTRLLATVLVTLLPPEQVAVTSF